MTSAAAYIRKSNDQQDRTEEVKSVATQRDLVTTFAAARGWALDDKHVYAMTGSRARSSLSASVCRPCLPRRAQRRCRLRS